MAERRMFAKTVIDSDLFLEMPITSQLLYFHLSMRADDDGFINKPKSIMRLIGCKEDDMKVLISNQFVVPFDTGVVVIRHWRVHNYIQSDRYKPTQYQAEKAKITLDESNVYIMDTNCIQPVSDLETQDRLELGKSKDSLELEEKREPSGSRSRSSKPINHKYGEYKHVKLTDEQYLKLIADFGEQKIAEYIKRCDEYCQQYGKSYKDYNLTIRKWIAKDMKKQPNQPNKPKQYDDLLEVLNNDT